jgi:hypothetical protein
MRLTFSMGVFLVWVLVKAALARHVLSFRRALDRVGARKTSLAEGAWRI